MTSMLISLLSCLLLILNSVVAMHCQCEPWSACLNLPSAEEPCCGEQTALVFSTDIDDCCKKCSLDALAVSSAEIEFISTMTSSLPVLLANYGSQQSNSRMATRQTLSRPPPLRQDRWRAVRCIWLV